MSDRYTHLKNGQATSDPRLDRVRHVDLRSLNYLISDRLEAEAYHKPRSYTWSIADQVLDQGALGACVGMGLTAEFNARPKVRHYDSEFAKQVYYRAQQQDPWPGGSYENADPYYEGTSVLAGAQVAVQMGEWKSYRWAMDMPDLYTAIGYWGPAVIGVDWYTGMMTADAEGYIRPTGQIEGGHCVCVRGVKVVKDPFTKELDYVRSYFLVRNSWGSGWGMSGDCRLAFIDMAALFSGGDFAVPVR